MLESKASQFSLSPDGHILWQEKQNNPVPGVAVAKLEKGAHAMHPLIKVLETDLTAKQDANTLKNHLAIWLKTHTQEVLEPLTLLETPQGVEPKQDAVSKIAAKIYDGLGIVPREDLEDVIADLTPETRVDLRAKKIRLGPVLAFIPILKKPAAVKLRAIFWSLYNDAPLPAKVPADGIVSARIDDENPNEDFYRAISYPLYGGRAVRIDMLDRVISCVYDHADKGKFQARHEMAEWLGCTIDDLYKVLEAMGHTKTYDPADHIEPETTVEEKPAEESPKAEEATTSEPAPQADTPKPEAKKPELATFRLKKGKAFQKGEKATDRRDKKKFDKSTDKKKDSSRKKDFKSKDKKKPRDNSPRIISIEAKKNDEDSPFAILQQLKK
ncbi:MAG: hypothetical protein ACRBDI_09255 [Alphaproteobacteria bacterium]